MVFKRGIKVFVACEESQTVCKAFRRLGFEAYSCDIVECSGGHPEWHLQMDALAAVKLTDWDLIIAHPPCTYLTRVSMPFLRPRGVYNPDRLNRGYDAAAFFMALSGADCPCVAVENPTPCKVFGRPKPTQGIQPYEFGHPYTKKTWLWLRGLPKLTPTDIVEPTASWTGAKRNPRDRSKTFGGIADAMARQWGDYLMLK